MATRIAVLAEMLLGASLLLGCSSDGPELGRVTGTVSLDGKPVPSVIVVFQPSSGRPAMGVTDAQGKFEVDFTWSRKGALVGQSDVYLDPIPADGLEPGMLPAPKIPRKFLVPFEKAQIAAGQNEFKFELSSK